MRTVFQPASMDFSAARLAILNVLKGARPEDLPRLLHWIKTTSDFDEFISNNDDVILRSIAEDLRHSLPKEAMLNSEHIALQKLQEQTKPTVHIDAFLYDDNCIDSLCDKGKMSRNYCLTCGSHRTAPLGKHLYDALTNQTIELSLVFLCITSNGLNKGLIQKRLHYEMMSASLCKIKAYEHYPLWHSKAKSIYDIKTEDRLKNKCSLAGLNTERDSQLFSFFLQGYFLSSASHLYGVEMNADFCQLQEAIIAKYQLCERVKVVNADICTQASLLQNADVVVMNNVFEYFLDRLEQSRCWEFIHQNVRKKGSLLVTVPSLEKSLANLQVDIQLNQWVESVPLNYDVYLEEDADREALEEINLYRIL
nr:PREDICTED: uncharacterized protein LOC103277674 [Anolis carolinensis]|eukprot:XP_016846266.1 PREDICTED: uncharacterized protein LOC103277674 [Anolis carolinensis]